MTSSKSFEEAIKNIYEQTNDEILRESHEEDFNSGVLHGWLGIPRGAEISDGDIAKGIASINPHIRELAKYAKTHKKSGESKPSTIPIIKAKKDVR